MEDAAQRPAVQDRRVCTGAQEQSYGSAPPRRADGAPHAADGPPSVRNPFQTHQPSHCTNALASARPTGSSFTCTAAMPPFRCTASCCGAHTAAVSPRLPLRAPLRHFIRTPNFLAWLRSRVRQVERQLRRVYLTALCEADVATWMKDKHEIRRVDFMLRVQDELVRGPALRHRGLVREVPALTLRGPAMLARALSLAIADGGGHLGPRWPGAAAGARRDGRAGPARRPAPLARGAGGGARRGRGRGRHGEFGAARDGHPAVAVGARPIFSCFLSATHRRVQRVQYPPDQSIPHSNDVTCVVAQGGTDSVQRNCSKQGPATVRGPRPVPRSARMYRWEGSAAPPRLGRGRAAVTSGSGSGTGGRRARGRS